MVGCFAAGTPVKTEHGDVPIEEIRAGHKVWALDPETDEWQLTEVIGHTLTEYEGDVVAINLQNEDGTREPLVATGNHPFWVASGAALDERPHAADLPLDEPKPEATGRWIDARNLRLGDVFMARSGESATVVGLTIRFDRIRVYNLNVHDLHNYAVGGDGVLVHNAHCWKNFGVKTYRDQQQITAGLGGELHAHHLIEKRFAKVFRIDDGWFKSIVLTRAQHQEITNRWRRLIAYGTDYSTLTPEEILKKAREVYHDMPEVLQELERGIAILE